MPLIKRILYFVFTKDYIHGIVQRAEKRTLRSLQAENICETIVTVT